MKKLFFALIVVAALLLVAMPAAAQGPNPWVPVFFDRTSQMTAAWVGDPFGGNPKLNVGVKYEPDGKGGVAAKFDNALFPLTGITAKFGLSPFSSILPGGIPSSMSGDGSGPRKAIYIGGAWADAAVNPFCNFAWDPNPNDTKFNMCRDQTKGETPFEIPACATVKIPAGSSKWFKLDTWLKDNAGRGLRTQIWLDDELDGATKPSGKAVFGAADRYYYGTAPYDGWSANVYWGANAQNPEEINGYFMLVYDPDALQPNYAFAPPNAAIFTLDVSGAGSLRRSCTAAAFAGQPCVPASKGGSSTNTGTSLTGMLGNQAKIQGASYNPAQPNHLLWTEGRYNGWVFVRVWNQMIWDGTVSVCSYRQVAW